MWCCVSTAAQDRHSRVCAPHQFRMSTTLKTEAKAGLADRRSPLPSAAGGVGSSSNRNLGPAALTECGLSHAGHAPVCYGRQWMALIGTFDQVETPVPVKASTSCGSRTASKSFVRLASSMLQMPAWVDKRFLCVVRLLRGPLSWLLLQWRRRRRRRHGRWRLLLHCARLPRQGRLCNGVDACAFICSGSRTEAAAGSVEPAAARFTSYV